MGSPAAGHGSTGTASAVQRREAWAQRGEPTSPRRLSPAAGPRRGGPAGRERDLSGHPRPWWEFEGSDEEHAELLDEHEIEPVEWMAAHGHLTDAEIAKIAGKANEARPRIGTDAERIGSGGVDRADRRAVKLHEAVQRALSGLEQPP